MSKMNDVDKGATAITLLLCAVCYGLAEVPGVACWIIGILTGVLGCAWVERQ